MSRSRLAVIGGSLCTAFVLAELGLRMWSPIPPGRLLPFPYNRERVEQIVDDGTYLRFDQELGWNVAPNRVRRSDGAVFRTNSMGMRADREYATAPPRDVDRIAAFGDSFTHCSEVTQNDCWVPLLEDLWPRTEVMNFGVIGYGPDQAWLRYQRDGRPYQPCGVLIGYFVEDIDRVVNRFRPFISPDDSVVMSKPRFLLEGDGLTLLPNPASRPTAFRDPKWVEQALGPHDAWYFPDMFVRSPLDVLMIGRLARTAAYQRARAALVRDGLTYPLYDDGQEALQVTERILVQFAAQVRSDGATPVILVFPGRRDLSTDWTIGRPYDRLVSRLAEAGIPTIDLTPPLEAESARTGVASLFVDRHYSKRGNLVVSETLAQRLPDILSTTCVHGPT